MVPWLPLSSRAMHTTQRLQSVAAISPCSSYTTASDQGKTLVLIGRKKEKTGGAVMHLRAKLLQVHRAPDVCQWHWPPGRGPCVRWWGFIRLWRPPWAEEGGVSSSHLTPPLTLAVVHKARRLIVTLSVRRAIVSGFHITSLALTPCQLASVQPRRLIRVCDQSASVCRGRGGTIQRSLGVHEGQYSGGSIRQCVSACCTYSSLAGRCAGGCWG